MKFWKWHIKTDDELRGLREGARLLEMTKTLEANRRITTLEMENLKLKEQYKTNIKITQGLLIEKQKWAEAKELAIALKILGHHLNETKPKGGFGDLLRQAQSAQQMGLAVLQQQGTLGFTAPIGGLGRTLNAFGV